jgi:cysteine-rich repeat protein
MHRSSLFALALGSALSLVACSDDPVDPGPSGSSSSSGTGAEGGSGGSTSSSSSSTGAQGGAGQGGGGAGQGGGGAGQGGGGAGQGGGGAGQGGGGAGQGGGGAGQGGGGAGQGGGGAGQGGGGAGQGGGGAGQGGGGAGQGGGGPGVCGNGALEAGETCDDSNIVGNDCCTATCTIEPDCEVEVNNTIPQANDFAGTAVNGTVYGHIDPEGDFDIWEIVVPAGDAVALVAEIGPGKEGTVCDSSSVVGGDAEVTLYNSNGVQVGNDDDGGVDYCSMLSIGLFPGTYYLEVRASDLAAVASEVFDYSLNIETTPVICGNGDVSSPETCDDGDTTGGDGCSATCTTEPGYGCTGEPSVCVMIPAASCALPIVVSDGFNFVAADITIYGDDYNTFPTATCTTDGAGRSELVFRADLLAGETVNVSDFGGADLRLRILDGGMCGGATPCAVSIDGPENTPGASYTAAVAGPVYMVVETFSTTPGSKDIDLDFAISACGDGIIDVGQACDDGDTSSGDGCSATCTVEPGYTCTGAPSVCTNIPLASCADPIVVLDGSTFAAADITVFGDNLGMQPTASCTTDGTGRSELVFRADLQAGETLNVTDSGSADLMLKVLAGGMCGNSVACAAATDEPEVVGGVSYTASAAGPVYVSVETYSTSPGSKAIDLDFLISPCGDGVIDPGQACDDGNNTSGDGCTACVVDAGFACAGSPSGCAAVAVSTCAAPIVATDGFHFSGNTMASFGDELNAFDTTGADTCITEGGGGRPDIVFSVAVAAGQTLNVKDFGSIDVVFKVLSSSSCASGSSCLASYDAGNSGEATTGVSYTAAVAGTVYVVVESYSANPSATSTYDIRFDLTP